MTGEEQERLGENISLIGVAIMAACVFWMLYVGPYGEIPYALTGLGITGFCLIVAGGPIMLHGQYRKFRE